MMHSSIPEAASIDWQALEKLSAQMRSSADYSALSGESKAAIEIALTALTQQRDWQGIIRLRSLFEFLASGEPIAQRLILSNLNLKAINAAEAIGDHRLAGRFLHDEGQMLHRQGKHEAAIEAFERSASHWERAGEKFPATESIFMTALCYRALGQRRRARDIIEQILQETGMDLWRANPLSVLSWLQQDDGDLPQAERTIRESIELFENLKGQDDIQVAQSLADLGEVVGFQGRFEEAEAIFQRALVILDEQSVPQPRLVARTLLKRAEVNIRASRLAEAISLLRQAYLSIAEAGYYDLIWRIQLAWAQVYWYQRDYVEVVRHVRLALKHRHEVGLSDWALVKQYFARLKMGTGLPR